MYEVTSTSTCSSELSAMNKKSLSADQQDKNMSPYGTSPTMSTVVSGKRTDTTDLESKRIQHYSSEIFIMSQFNAHYLSWIKNNEYFDAFFERLSCLSDSVLTLSHCQLLYRIEDCHEFKYWFMRKSIQDLFNYSRRLEVKLSNVTGINYYTPKKKLILSVDCNSGETSSGSNQFHSGIEDSITSDTETDSSSSVSGSDSFSGEQFLANMNQAKQLFNTEYRKQKQIIFNESGQKFETRFLGQIDLINDASCFVSLPVSRKFTIFFWYSNFYHLFG